MITNSKKNIIELVVIILPVILGFSKATFIISIFVLGGYFLKRGKLPTFYLLLFFYKYLSKNIVEVDVGLLNLFTTVISIYLSLLFLTEYRNLIFKTGAIPFLLFASYAVLSSTLSIIPSLSFAKSCGLLMSGIGIYYIVYKNTKEVVTLFINIYTVLVLSSLALPKSLTLYNANLGLHSGILNQSQAYGWLITLFLPLFVIKSKVSNFSKTNLFLILVGIYYLYSTHMRSAFIALFVIFLIVMLFDVIAETYRFKIIFLGIILLGVFLSQGRISLLEKLFDKRGVEVSGIGGIEEMLNSRSQKATPSLTNFYSRPIFGIGYGLPTESTNINYDYRSHWGISYFPGTNFVISFPVEKGVLYTAILEELGIIGFILFLNLVIRGLNNVSLRILIIAPLLILSLGEASLFSLNGIGVFGFVILAICTKPGRIEWDSFF